MNTRTIAAVAAAGLSLLSACGGGGGTTTSTASSGTGASLTLSGYAAKGALNKAVVGVYAVQSDGTLATTASATSTSGSDGSYALPSFVPSTGTQYVVVVGSDGVNTTQADESTGTIQSLPASFAIRAFVPATAASTSTLQITPFSELAVAAAAKRAYSPAAVSAATASVISLIGFDPRFVQPKTVATSADSANSSADKIKEIQLAALLASVSTMANTSAAALGCTAADAGQATACVVAKLADGFTVSTSGSTTTAVLSSTVASALSSAIATVAAANPTTVGSLVATVAAAVQGATPATAVATAPSGSSPASSSSSGTVVASTPASSSPAATTPEEAVKTLFTDLKTNLSTLFSSTNATVQGAINLQATQFRDSIKTVAVPLDVANRDADALTDGVNAYLAFKNGAYYTDANGIVQFSAPHCSVYQDSGRTTLSTSAGNANFVGCATRFHDVDNHSVHRFLLTPHSDGVTFDYEAEAQVCGSGGSYSDRSDCVAADNATSTAAFHGTVQAVLAASTNAEFSSLTLTGNLPPAFATGSSTAVLLNPNGKSTWAISLVGSDLAQASSQPSSAPHAVLVQHSYAFSGTLSTYSDLGTTLSSKVTIKPGSSVTYLIGQEATSAVSAVVDTPQSEFEGTVTSSNGTFDASGTRYIPTDVALTGALRNVDASGTYRDFFVGKLTAHVDPAVWAAYDVTQSATETNSVNISLGFVGTTTAPQRPSLGLSLSASYDYGNGGLTSYSGQYATTDASGNLLHTLALSGSQGTGITATEASSGISFSLTPGISVTDVTQNGSAIATLDRSKHLITFPNGDFVSLEFGF